MDESCAGCAPEGALFASRTDLRTFWQRHARTVALTGNVTLAVLCWASAFPVIKVALQTYSATNLAAFRFLISGAALVLIGAVLRIRLPSSADLPRIFAAGLTGVAGYHLALNFGQKTVTAGAASFITSTTPVLTAIMAGFFLREKLRLAAWLGFALSLTGAATIAVAENKSFGLNTGALSVLLAAVFQSLYFIIQKPLLNRYTPLEVVAYSVWAGCLMFLVFTPGIAAEFSQSTSSANTCVLFLALFPGLIGFLCWSRVMALLPASKAVSFLYLNPLLATFLSWLWLAEAPGWFTFIGGSLALAGVILVSSRK